MPPGQSRARASRDPGPHALDMSDAMNTFGVFGYAGSTNVGAAYGKGPKADGTRAPPPPSPPGWDRPILAPLLDSPEDSTHSPAPPPALSLSSLVPPPP